eukprot:GEMP01026034.1.p1 GENE.GEMP01026034.1~~GEMP01026034.1.p1  ORF type:complete len:467 (+),score=64.40 GEMP01026034.1:239-1639(+)
MGDAERQPPQTADNEADRPRSSIMLHSPIRRSYTNGVILPVYPLPVALTPRDGSPADINSHATVSWVDPPQRTPTSVDPPQRTPTFGGRSTSTLPELEPRTIDRFADILGNIPIDEVVVPYERVRLQRAISPQGLLRRVATFPNLLSPTAEVESQQPSFHRAATLRRLASPISESGRQDFPRRTTSSHRIGSAISLIPCGLSRATSQDLVEWSYTASVRSPRSSLDSCYQERRMRQRHAEILPGQQLMIDNPSPFAFGSAEIAEVIHNLRYYDQFSSAENIGITDRLSINWKLVILIVVGMVLDLLAIFTPSFHLESDQFAKADYLFAFHEDYPYYVIAGILIVASFGPSLFTLINTLMGRYVKSASLGPACVVLPILLRAVAAFLNRELVTEMLRSPHHFSIPDSDGNTFDVVVYNATVGCGFWACLAGAISSVALGCFVCFQKGTEVEKKSTDHFADWWSQFSV